ncbi:hypothetical protein SAMN05444166_7481 [Singulisphaera sp. GP187]|uniref:hypothetical protein n=1 Tax=Singulisphaera sp. GP187 TaxID=1882752 RepID=UPI00092736B6|nr:hypothetical protein [Singulisphaera sp. GP187]SIO64914.1 hypothetical protein SAMN05444166_7481 [Singulisphaera sp. GP187]
MKTWLIQTARALSLFLGAVVLLAGCESKGPAEKAGENLDKSVQEAKDAVHPPSVAEKAGHAIENAGEKAAHAIDKAGEKAGHAIEKAEEKLKEGVQEAKDAIHPPGTAEKAGRAIDNAVKP